MKPSMDLSMEKPKQIGAFDAQKSRKIAGIIINAMSESKPDKVTGKASSDDAVKRPQSAS